jgi:DmsE family decaheme c-type cytochrome
MHRNVPVTRLSIGAAPGSKPGLRAFLMLLLGVSISCATASAGPRKGHGASPAQAAAAAPAASDYVGADVCVACHESVVKGFAENPHQKMTLMHGSKGVTCENCHGPGKAHVEGGGDKTKIFNFNTAAPKDIDSKCLGCHAGTHPNFDRSPHAKAGISCNNCHSVHASKAPEYLLKAAQPTLCYQCHGDVRTALNMPFHHPVNEGAISCNDCHDVHGTFEKNNLRTTADQNNICTKCHADTRGPYVYEHAAVKAEGCLGCHSPHGSQNARMLNMPSINTLCNQCHSRVANATIHGMGAGSDDLQPCTSCHTFIHGSNINAAFLR